MAEEHAKRPDGLQERIIYVEGDVASCSGENNDHPLTYYRIPKDGYVVCVCARSSSIDKSGVS